MLLLPSTAALSDDHLEDLAEGGRRYEAVELIAVLLSGAEVVPVVFGRLDS